MIFLYIMLVNRLTYEQLSEDVGENVVLRSSCEFFPNFIVSGRVLDVSIGNNNEYLINIKTKPTGKEMTVGSNMRNLSIIKG